MTLFVSILVGIFLVYFLSFILVSIGFFKQVSKNFFIEKNSTDVKISVVIAVRNEELTIAKCVDSIVNQNYSPDFYEIILIDDHSTDNTVAVLTQLANKYENVRYYQLTNTYSKKEAIKLGVNVSSNTIIATTDGDCILPENWLDIIVTNFSASTNFLFGPVEMVDKPIFLNKFQQLDMFAMQGLTFGSLFFNQPLLCNAANMSFNKMELNSMNTLANNSPSGDDVFLLHQFKKRKKIITGLLNNNFVVQTKAEDNLKGFINQRVRWGSKSTLYKDKLLLFFSYLVYCTNICVVFIYFHVLFIEQNRGVYIILLLSKWVIDFILLFLVSSFFNKRKLMNYFVPIQVLYPFYIIVVGFISQFFKFSWKGRIYNG